MQGHGRGRTLGGRYHLDDVLGVGGMSTVWRAHDPVLGRDVAVKLLSGRHATDAESRQRIRIEARAAAALAHPNIAQVYDFGETVEDGQRTPYVVMELVPGLTLERPAGSPLPPQRVFRIGAEVAAGLAAAHAIGLVHRDVKPANVLLGPTGAKVVDFGISAPAGAGESGDELLGTPEYLAPERLTDDPVTPASDVYSLGVVLYRLLTGRLPWPASIPADLLEAHLCTPPAPLPELPGLPPEIADLCLRCLAKSPADRPSAVAVATALAAAAGIRTVADEPAYEAAPPAADGGPSTILVRPPGADSPVTGADSPVTGADSPVTGADSPVTGADSPLAGDGSLAAGDGSLAAGDGSFAAGAGLPPAAGDRRRRVYALVAVAVVAGGALVAWSLVPEPGGRAPGAVAGTSPSAA
ncbi:serine/threonine-protein kinase, partial [Dactylosporangium matsuzakiense]|uniref:serine/threonine-protein kinase n=1 Tax=Dactylosporangium matsuzakiense TaxID=53360 RepID=UPI0022F2BCDD